MKQPAWRKSHASALRKRAKHDRYRIADEDRESSQSAAARSALRYDYRAGTEANRNRTAANSGRRGPKVRSNRLTQLDPLGSAATVSRFAAEAARACPAKADALKWGRPPGLRADALVGLLFALVRRSRPLSNRDAGPVEPLRTWGPPTMAQLAEADRLNGDGFEPGRLKQKFAATA